jgi:hypothetical protein
VRKFVAVLVMALASSLTAIAPAAAVGIVTMQSEDLRLSSAQECGDVTVRVTVPYDIPKWSVDLTVYGPDGSYAGGGYYYEGADPNDIIEYVNLCADYDGTGTYSVVADVETHDASYNSLGNYRVSDSFEFSKQPMQSSNFVASVKPSGVHDWKITGRLTRGGDPWSFKRTEIQVYLYGSWRKLKAKPTDRRGVVVWTSTPERGAGQFRFRLYAPESATTKAAASRSMRVYAR